jgi:hypothetical protein
MMAPPFYGQSIKCLYPRTRSGVRAWNALEEGGACSRAARTLERGGARSREAFSHERGEACPREACALERGGACSRGSLSGPLRWAVRATVAWATPCVLKRGVFGFGSFAGFKWGFPSSLRGPLGLSPTVASEHLRVRRQGSRRCWSLMIGLPSLLVLRTLSMGPRQRTRGSSPRSPIGAWVLLQGFTAIFGKRAWHVFQPASAMFQPASVTHALQALSTAGAIQEV